MEFLEALKSLEDNIQFLVDHDKISSKMIRKYEAIVNSFRAFYNEQTAWEKKLQRENRAAYLKHSFLEEKVLKLEAICLMHGITDIITHMSKPTDLLFSEASEAMKQGKIFIPAELIDIRPRENHFLPEKTLKKCVTEQFS